MSAEIRTVLVTGSSGFIGSRLIATLSAAYEVIALSRAGGATVQGTFVSPDDLALLDEFPIDALVHLGAVTGGCSEEDGLSVNVDGTRRLVRYLIGRGCRHFVLASSIAAVGCLNPTFLPRELPISDDHPCDATDAYGLSKGLMEEVIRYFHRQQPELDFTLFRIGLVLPEDTPPIDEQGLADYSLPFTELGAIAVDDVLAALRLPLEREGPAGLRRVNLVAPTARTPIPTADAIERLLGAAAAGLDLSAFRQPGHAFDGVFATDRLGDYFDFVPEVAVRTMTRTDRVTSKKPAD